MPIRGSRSPARLRPGKSRLPPQPDMVRNALLVTVVLAALDIPSVSSAQGPEVQKTNAVSVYVGRYTRDTLLQVFYEPYALNFDDRDYIAVVAVSRVLKTPSTTRSWELEGQFGKHFDGQSHAEVNLALFHRWGQYPWNSTVRTTMAVGAGLSYAFEDPPLEATNPSNDGTTRLQSYLGFEVTLAPPAWDDFAFLLRVHHRSTVAGLFGNVDSGSNYLSLGLRYRFQ